MYLIDTNVFLEGLLEQDKAKTVKSFFQKIDLNMISITDLSLHSIGIILYRLGKHELFIKFLNDLIIDGMDVLSLSPQDLKILDNIARELRLDFDDAYQYTVAERYNLQLISFDKDFDNTKRGRKEPSAVLSGLQH